MPRPAPVAAIDARLESLLDIEHKLEARVRAAQSDATARVAAAREAARQRDDDWRAALDVESRREEQASLEVHARELRRIAEEAEAQVAALASAPESVIERLAQEAYAIVLGGDPP